MFTLLSLQSRNCFYFISSSLALTSLEGMQICTISTEFCCLHLNLMFMLLSRKAGIFLLLQTLESLVACSTKTHSTTCTVNMTTYNNLAQRCYPCSQFQCGKVKHQKWLRRECSGIQHPKECWKRMHNGGLFGLRCWTLPQLNTFSSVWQNNKLC